MSDEASRMDGIRQNYADGFDSSHEATGFMLDRIAQLQADLGKKDAEISELRSAQRILAEVFLTAKPPAARPSRLSEALELLEEARTALYPVDTPVYARIVAFLDAKPPECGYECFGPEGHDGPCPSPDPPAAPPVLEKCWTCGDAPSHDCICNGSGFWLLHTAGTK